MVLRRPSLVASAVTPLVAVSLFGCSLLHHGATATDGGSDGAVAAAVLDAAVASAPATPDNVNEVGRFPDEVSVNDAEAKIADPQISARNSVPGGALVATLRLGTQVTQVAKHESFILGIFPDPKHPTHTLEGWIAEQAFVAGPTVPKKGGCPAGKTQLIFDEQDFCGKTCKADAECPSGQTCGGKANLLVGAKSGAEVSTCTLPAGAGTGLGAKSDSGAGAPLH